MASLPRNPNFISLGLRSLRGKGAKHNSQNPKMIAVITPT